jgi:hypothetical protein
MLRHVPLAFSKRIIASLGVTKFVENAIFFKKINEFFIKDDFFLEIFFKKT